jgi:hypothetical protein
MKQPNPVSVRSVVLRGRKSCVHVGKIKGNLDIFRSHRNDGDVAEALKQGDGLDKTKHRGIGLIQQTPMFNLLRCYEKSDLNRSRKEIGSSVSQGW